MDDYVSGQTVNCGEARSWRLYGERNARKDHFEGEVGWYQQSLQTGDQGLPQEGEEGEEAGAASHHHVHVHVGHRDREHVLVSIVVVVVVVVIVVIVIVVVLGVDHVDNEGGGEDGEAHEVEHVKLVARAWATPELSICEYKTETWTDFQAKESPSILVLMFLRWTQTEDSSRLYHY